MKSLNWKIINNLALLGVAMGVATILGWVGSYEGLVWLLVATICAVAISRLVAYRHFHHGVLTGVFISLAAQMLQVIFFPVYLANNLGHTADFNQLPIDFPPRLFLLILTPFIAAASGIVLGVMSWGAARAVPKIDKKLAEHRGNALD
ncbi:MAG: hypothetical protein ACREOO_03375 [bacterium]